MLVANKDYYTYFFRMNGLLNTKVQGKGIFV